MEIDFVRKVLLGLFFFVVVNLLVVDAWIIINTKKSAEQAKITPSPIPEVDKSCPDSCLAEIDKAKTSIASATPSATSQPSRQSSGQTTSQQTTENSVKEFFIPLGSGTSSADDWTDIPGVKAEIDKTKYEKIQKILFEVSVHVPNANEIVEVRLYNESDKYIVVNSEIAFPSGTTQNFRIAEISLGEGSKIYKVQMKTQLEYPASLDQARIHLTTF